jgi:hypothetical protein
VAALVRMPAIAQFTKLTAAAWEHHPTSYWYCSNDQAIPYDFQQYMVSKTEQLGGIKIRTEVINCGHSPFLSHPDLVFKLIEKTLGEGVE